MTETMTGRLSENLDKKIRTEIPNLPFIKQNNDQIVFWSVRPSGDYAKDCRTGREYGALALEHMVEAEFSPFLTWCICMSSKGFGQVGHKNRRWFQVPNTFFESIKQPLMNNYTSCVEAWFFS